MILKDEDVRKRTLGSSHIAANSDAQDQSMNDNSTLDSDAQDGNVNNDHYIDSLQCSSLMIAMMIAKNVMILND